MRTRLSAFAALAGIFSLPCIGQTGPVHGVRHVVIVGADGLSPDGLLHAKVPNIDRLRRSGAYTYHARGVMPTSSSPNWASMIMGAGPEQHGVTSNDWQPDKFEIPPVCAGSGGIFPTIFGVLRQQRPQAVIGLFHDWDGFARLMERKAADAVERGDGPVETMRKAVDFVKSRRPSFLFVQLDHVDSAGHKHGYGSPEYLTAVEEADRLIGDLLRALENARLLEESVFLVTADHGGVGKKHGGATMAELEIPWIVTGPGVVKGRELRAPLNIYDTAATVAYIFGLKPPACWIGQPVRDAFSGK